MRGRDIFVGGLVAALVSGCASSSTIDYVEESRPVGTSSSSESTAVPETTSPWNDQHLDGTAWTDTITVKDYNGDDYHVKINTKLSVPQPESECSIYEYEVLFLTPEKKKEIVGKLFPTGQVYCYDDPYIPKSVVEKKIEYNEEQLKNATEQNKEFYEEYGKNLKKQWEQAPDDYVPAEDFSGSNYLGERNGWKTVVCFTGTEDPPMYEMDGGMVEKLEPVEHNGIWRDFSLFLKEEYQYAEEKPFGLQPSSMSDEELDSEVQEIMEALGLENMERTSEWWRTVDCHAEFSQGPDTGFHGQLVNSDMNITVKDEQGREHSLYVLESSRTTATFFESCGLYALSMTTPYRMVDVKKEVPLLGFADIAAIVKDEFENHPERYLIDHMYYPTYDQMERVYVEIAADGGRVSKIPYWRLSSSIKMGAVMLINAVDGSCLNDSQGASIYFD